MPERGPAGERPLTQFAGVGLADDDGAGGAQAAHHLGVGVGVGDLAVGAEPGRHAGDVDVVLDRDRDAEQGEGRIALSGSAFAIRGGRLGERGVAQHHAEGVERGLAGLDRVERPADQVDGRRTAAGEGEELVSQGGEAGAGSGGSDHHCPEYRRCELGFTGEQWKTVRMRLYRDRAVVLRQHKLGEADRIVTPAHSRSRLGARGGQGGAAHPQQVRGAAGAVRAHRRSAAPRPQSRHRHPGAVAIDAFATDIVSDYGRYTCACAVLETAERLAGEERAPVPALHRLTVGALRAVADGGRPRELVLDAYLLRAMGIAGWAPALTECARCAAPGPHRAFHVAAGGSVCVHCRPSGSMTPPQGVLDLMAALHDGDWEHAAGVAARRTAARPADWWPRTCSGIWNGSCGRCRWSSGSYRTIAAVADHRAALVGQDMAHGNREAEGQAPATHSCPRRLTTIRRSRTSRPGRWSSRSCRRRPTAGSPRPPQHTSKAAAPQIPADQVPNHVAVVMDGNGRWATQRGLGRTEGHKMGEAVLIDITCGAIEIGIKHLTVYAFSTENWKRSTEEVRFLMGFNREVVRRRRENLNDDGRADALGRARGPGCGAASSRSSTSPSR